MAVEVLPSTRNQSLSDELRGAQRARLLGLLLPGLLWLALFFAAPLVVIVLYSVLTPGPTGAVVWQPTLGNYAQLFTQELYVNAYWRSLTSGVATTLICLLLGYPLALYIVRSPPRRRAALLFLVLIPFWTNFLVRTYAWMIILANNGPLNSLLDLVGLGPWRVLNSTTAVLIGLVYGELPFMILPLYASIDRFDFTLLEAAGDLGASRWRAFWRVMLPMTMPGIAAGSVLVFIPTVGQFVVSDLLGGGKVDYFGNLLQRLFTRSNPPNWPLGSAMALVFLIAMTAVIIFYFRATTEDDR